MARKFLCPDCNTRHEPGQCPMQGGTGKCAKCGNKIDQGKRNQGHSPTCPVILALDDPRERRANPARPKVKTEAHSGDWRKLGQEVNDLGHRVTTWQCRTCKRVASTMGATEPGRCPEVR